jgi:acyl-CoA synthetase (NDP forming)
MARAAFDQSLFARMMRPRSVAVIGMSTKPNTASHAVLRNLQVNEFAGDIHLIGRSAAEVESVPIRTDISTLPENVDVAVLTVPAAGVGEALEACVARKVGIAVVFASGFAEIGEAARGEQERIGKLALDGGLAVLGPNCLGYTNFVDGFVVGFASVSQAPRLAPGTTDAVAIVAQSGGLGNHVRLGLDARGVPVSHTISTGNEMGLGLGDFTRFLLADAATRVVTVYAEHIRQPEAFLEAARQARSAGKAIVMLHPGRSARAKQAAQSHTGALAGDYAVMRAQVERAGVLLVDSLDELLDTTEILARHATPARGGLGVMTFSGAYCGIVHDFCEEIDVPVPPLAAETEAHLTPLVPSYIPPKNPLDLGTQPLWQPELVGIGLEALLKDPGIGAVAISIPAGAPRYANAYMKNIIAAKAVSEKPMALAMLGDGSPLPPEFIEAARENKIVLSRSSDRTLRALGAIVKWANRAPPGQAGTITEVGTFPPLGAGPQPEWLGKQVLAAAGIRVPRGRLATTAEEATAIAAEIGFPVAMKAQAAALAHKTEAGGVLLGLADAAAVSTGWKTLHASIERAQPGLRLDGILVEAMAQRGLELVVGAKRDAQWGPIVLVGLGGILVEALQDVRIIAADASQDEILVELDKLKTARLLHGFRNTPPVDVEAVAAVTTAVGRLMLAHPEIMEIDVNPLMVHARGHGATALDALIVTA